ncbi:hypothetical protein OW491_00125 [Neptunomonas sp. CHC150]|nr:hypothetical protein [Neptunomonas sp. CHC150]MDN2658206.1 hypothetical protein [Neptunomonas sp. CHC150]
MNDEHRFVCKVSDEGFLSLSCTMNTDESLGQPKRSAG